MLRQNWQGTVRNFGSIREAALVSVLPSAKCKLQSSMNYRVPYPGEWLVKN